MYVGLSLGFLSCSIDLDIFLMESSTFVYHIAFSVLEVWPDNTVEKSLHWQICLGQASAAESCPNWGHTLWGQPHPGTEPGKAVQAPASQPNTGQCWQPEARQVGEAPSGLLPSLPSLSLPNRVSSPSFWYVLIMTLINTLYPTFQLSICCSKESQLWHPTNATQ